MRRRALVALVLAVVIAVPAVSLAIGGNTPAAPLITVSPRTGSPRTRFRVSLRAPARTGSYGTSQRRYLLSAIGPAGKVGCVPRVADQLPASSRGARLTLTLDPANLGGSWCVGTYHGRIVEIRSPVCASGEMCPDYVQLVGTVGEFTFRVTRP